MHSMFRGLSSLLLGMAVAAPVAAPEPDGRRRHLPEPDLHEVVRRVQQEDRRPDQLPVHRLRRRHPPVHRRHRGFRRHRRADERVADRRRQRQRAPRADRARRGGRHLQPARPSATPSSSSTATTLVDIFMGRVTKWNDKRLAALNPGVQAAGPGHHRGPPVRRLRARPTSSPTILNKFSREWKDKVGYATSVNWPVGLGGKGNEGVTQQVKQIEGALGYVELIYAISNKLPLRADQERGRQASSCPSLESVTAAAAGAKLAKDTDFRVSITNAPGAEVVPDRVVHLAAGHEGHEGSGQGQVSRDFLAWMITPEAQKMASRPELRAAAGRGGLG